jgi:hypothetical protein
MQAADPHHAQAKYHQSQHQWHRDIAACGGWEVGAEWASFAKVLVKVTLWICADLSRRTLFSSQVL